MVQITDGGTSIHHPGQVSPCNLAGLSRQRKARPGVRTITSEEQTPQVLDEALKWFEGTDGPNRYSLTYPPTYQLLLDEYQRLEPRCKRPAAARPRPRLRHIDLPATTPAQRP